MKHVQPINFNVKPALPSAVGRWHVASINTKNAIVLLIVKITATKSPVRNNRQITIENFSIVQLIIRNVKIENLVIDQTNKHAVWRETNLYFVNIDEFRWSQELFWRVGWEKLWRRQMPTKQTGFLSTRRQMCSARKRTTVRQTTANRTKIKLSI